MKRGNSLDLRRMAVLVARSQKATHPFFFQTWILCIVCLAFHVEAFDPENIRTETEDHHHRGYRIGKRGTALPPYTKSRGVTTRPRTKTTCL